MHACMHTYKHTLLPPSISPRKTKFMLLIEHLQFGTSHCDSIEWLCLQAYGGNAVGLWEFGTTINVAQVLTILLTFGIETCSWVCSQYSQFFSIKNNNKKTKVKLKLRLERNLTMKVQKPAKSAVTVYEKGTLIYRI